MSALGTKEKDVDCSYMSHIVLIAHNLRSCHNVGSLLRTAEGLGVEAVWLTGYTPYPVLENDSRLPHEALKITKQIHKTALGAEDFQCWYRSEDVLSVISNLKKYGYTLAALEQTPDAVSLHDFQPPERLALIVGREVEGIEQAVLKQCDEAIQIPMAGKKESFNVTVAAAMALHHLLFAA